MSIPCDKTFLLIPSSRSSVKVEFSKNGHSGAIHVSQTHLVLFYSSVLQHLYSVIFLPLLGHAVSLLLNIAEGEKARNVKILAMECLLDLSQADSKCKVFF